jgi:hypothetical protein
MRVWILAVATATIPLAEVCAQGTPQSYQFELMGGFSLTSIDFSPSDLDITEIGVGGTYYFNPVSLESHPWNEAAFLEHSKGVMLGLGFTDFELGPFNADGPSIGAGFLYADKEKPIAAQINVSFGTLEGDMGVDIDLVNIGGWAGYWLQQNALVGIEIDYDELDGSGAFTMEELFFGGFGKIVYDLEEGRAINAEARVGLNNVDNGAGDDTNVVIGLEGDFYFTPQYSAGALLNFSFGDSVVDEGVTLGVRGTAWFNQHISVSAEYATYSASDNLGADQDEFGIFVTARF